MKYSVGATIEKAGNSVLNKTSSWRVLKPVVENCKKCGLCATFCPEGIIRIKDTAIIDYDYCKGCGICAEECPIKGIKMVLENK